MKTRYPFIIAAVLAVTPAAAQTPDPQTTACNNAADRAVATLAESIPGKSSVNSLAASRSTAFFAAWSAMGCGDKEPFRHDLIRQYNEKITALPK